MHSYLVRILMPVVVIVGLGTGCRSPVDVDGAVAALIVGLSVRVENSSRAPVFYHALERETAAAVNWAPCVEGPHCRVIPAKSATTIPLTEVYGFDAASEEVLVYWWHRVPGPTISTYRAGEIRVVLVRR